MAKYACALSFLLVAVACGGSNDGGPTNNGVNDVRAACDIRAGWTQRTTVVCTSCMAISGAPKCDCPAYQQSYAGKCNAQQEAFYAEPTCDGVAGCVGKCDAADCNCVDACYAGRDACRVRAAALDGCQAEQCDATCR